MVALTLKGVPPWLEAAPGAVVVDAAPFISNQPWKPSQIQFKQPRFIITT